MTDAPAPNTVEAPAGEATLWIRPRLGAPHWGADLAARRLLDRPRSILIGLWLAGAVAFVLLAIFAASAPRFSGDLWVSRQVQQIDSVASHAPQTGRKTSEMPRRPLDCSAGRSNAANS